MVTLQALYSKPRQFPLFCSQLPQLRHSLLLPRSCSNQWLADSCVLLCRRLRGSVQMPLVMQLRGLTWWWLW